MYVWPRGLMVKALVFGTKDLCVRIAPWSLHSFLFASPEGGSCFERETYERLVPSRPRVEGLAGFINQCTYEEYQLTREITEPHVHIFYSLLICHC